MAAISETVFKSAGSNVEFFMDPDGKVTHLIDRAVEGDERFDRPTYPLDVNRTRWY